MNGTIILLVMAFGVGHFIEEQKSKEVLLALDNGISIKTEVFKKGEYYCPIYCKSDHNHIAHYEDHTCYMNKECHHFILSSISTVDNIDKQDLADHNIILPGSDPNVINASVNGKTE